MLVAYLALESLSRVAAAVTSSVSELVVDLVALDVLVEPVVFEQH